MSVYASKFLSGDDLIFELTTPSESVPSAATKTWHSNFPLCCPLKSTAKPEKKRKIERKNKRKKVE